MAVYGIGAMYGRTDDKSEEFVKREVAAIGYHRERAPGLHAQLAQIKAGDLMFIKSYAPQVGLYIKAVGIVTAPGIRRDNDLRWCIGVRWTWSGELKLGEIGCVRPCSSGHALRGVQPGSHPPSDRPVARSGGVAPDRGP